MKNFPTMRAACAVIIAIACLFLLGCETARLEQRFSEGDFSAAAKLAENPQRFAEFIERQVAGAPQEKADAIFAALENQGIIEFKYALAEKPPEDAKEPPLGHPTVRPEWSVSAKVAFSDRVKAAYLMSITRRGGRTERRKAAIEFLGSFPTEDTRKFLLEEMEREFAAIAEPKEFSMEILRALNAAGGKQALIDFAVQHFGRVGDDESLLRHVMAMQILHDIAPEIAKAIFPPFIARTKPDN